MPITSETTLREALRIRPRSVEALEDAAGFDFWNHLDHTLSDFCNVLSLDREALLAKLGSLPQDPPDRAWSSLPLYRLVDRLVRDHAGFRGSDLPEIERLLFTGDASVFPADYPLEAVKAEFHSFKIDFLLHMEEEEGYLFPKVLRTEGSLNHPEIAPESYKGSVAAYPYTMLHTPELRLKEMISDLRRRAGWSRSPGESYPLVREVEDRMESLEAKLVRHAGLETDILLPRTLQMEKKLDRRRPESCLLD